MPGLTTYGEAKILNRLLGDQADGVPATWYVGLFSVAPTDAGGGTEIATGGGTNYARVAVTNDTTNFPGASGGSPSAAANALAITFGLPGADWGTVVAWGLFDAASSGNLWLWANLAVARSILLGDGPPAFAIGQLAATLN